MEATDANVALDGGVSHSDNFPSDTWTAEFRETIAREVVRRGHWTLSSTKEDVDMEHDGLSDPSEETGAQSSDQTATNNVTIPAAPASITSSGLSTGGQEPVTNSSPSDKTQARPDTIITPNTETNLITVVEDATHTPFATGSGLQQEGKIQSATPHTRSGPNIDHASLPGDFDAYEHYQKRLDELKANENREPNKGEPTDSTLNYATALNSIASVSQALQELFPLAQSVMLTSQNGVLSRSSAAQPDPTIIHLHQLADDILLLLIQVDESGEGRPVTVHATTSQWLIT